MIVVAAGVKVHLALGNTDMRKDVVRPSGSTFGVAPRKRVLAEFVPISEVFPEILTKHLPAPPYRSAD